jgi:hypothetical protein
MPEQLAIGFNMNPIKPFNLKYLAFTGWLTVVALSFGCAKLPEGHARASGEITFKDGRRLTGVVGVVRFDPEELYSGGSRGASIAALNSDGTFDLMTRTPGDGVPIGDYRVVLVVRNADDTPADAVHFDYKHFETTPWRVKVTAGGPNHFELSLDPANERPLKKHDLPDHDW